MKNILLITSVLALAGCVNYPKYDPKAYSRLMVVKNKTDGRSEKLLDLGDAIRNGSKQTKYELKDAKGRTFHVFEKTELASSRFKTGQCVNYWMASDIRNPYYPQLSAATSDCKASVTQSEIQKDPFVNFGVIQQGIPHHERMLDSWLDDAEEKLIASWGTPSSIETVDIKTKKLVYYNSYSNVHTTVNGYNQVVDSWTETFWCRDTFVVTNRQIQSWSWQGNNCK